MEEVTDKHLEHFHEVAADHHVTQAKNDCEIADACDEIAKAHARDTGFTKLAAAFRKSADSHDAMADFHRSSEKAFKFVIAADLRKVAPSPSDPVVVNKAGVPFQFQHLVEIEDW